MPRLHLFFVHSGRLERCPNGTWADGVDSDTLGQELVGKTSDHGDLCTFGHGVIDQHRRSSIRDCPSTPLEALCIRSTHLEKQ